MTQGRADNRTQVVLALIAASSAIVVAVVGAYRFYPSKDDAIILSAPDAALDVGKDAATVSIPSQLDDLVAEVDAETTARLSVPSSLELYLLRDGHEYIDCPRKHSYRNPQDPEILWTVRLSCAIPLSAGRAHSIAAQQVNTNGDALTTKVVAHYSWRKASRTK